MDRKISNLSFSDDIAPIVKSKESSIAAIEMLDKFSEWSGTIKFAAHKFETVGFERRKNDYTTGNSKLEHKIISFDPELEYKGQKLKCAVDSGRFKVLCKVLHVNLASKETQDRLLKKVQTVLNSIDKAKVHNSIKVFFFKIRNNLLDYFSIHIRLKLLAAQYLTGPVTSRKVPTTRLYSFRNRVHISFHSKTILTHVASLHI